MLATKQESAQAFRNAKHRAKRYGIDPHVKGWLWRLTLYVITKRGYVGAGRIPAGYL